MDGKNERNSVNRNRGQKLPQAFADLPPELLEWTASNSYELVSICDVTGKVLFVSESIKKILGYSPERVVGTAALAYLDPSDQKHIQTKLLRQEGSEQNFCFRIRDINGRFIWMDATFLFFYYEEINENVFVAVIRNITDKKEAEEMMVRSEKMSQSGQLAAGVAHEIRNPLTSLRGFLQLLQTGVEEKGDYYKIMEEEIRKIESITSELLFVSKPLTDDKKPEKISLLLKDVLLLLRSEAKLAGINLSLHMEKEVEVVCDRSQIKQVFINLLKNAIESMESGGNIEVNVKEDRSESVCLIDVVDEGPGIPPEIFHRLTEPFFTTKKQGTGLGLMITKDIIRNHGGKLDIYSNEKKGSCFRISLPLNKNIS